MMQELFKTFVYLVTRTEPYLLEMTVGIILLLRGIWIINPWDEAYTAAVYALQMNTFPEWVWGVIAISIGISILAGLSTQSFRLRQTANLLSVVYIVFVLTSAIMAEPASLLVPVFIGLGAASILSYLRIELVIDANINTT